MNKEVITLPFDVALPPVKKLHAGTLSCLYERGNLRNIKMGETEIVQMIYSAVRDERWQTAPYEIENEKIEATDQTFSISYTALYTLNNIQYKAQFRIEGLADSTISYHMQGEALSHFKRNRIGICVLHPVAECAGAEALVIKEDGTSYKAKFPETISPHQPFLEIQQLHWKIEHLEAQLQFEGDIFETEDQRNWTDSSYKTYSTPLRLPIPAEVKKGDTINQKVTLRVVENAPRQMAKAAKQPTAREQKVPFPKLGFCHTAGSRLLNEEEHELLKKLPFHHYRAALHLDDPAWKDELQHAAADAEKLHVLLELVLFFSSGDAAEIDSLIEQLQPVSGQLFSILILHKNEKATPAALMQQCGLLLKQQFLNVQIGYGTDGNFADLNRNRPGETPHDFVSFSLYPQVHATDTRTILENLQTQHHTLETIHTFTGKPAHISPATFSGRHVTESDPRQKTNIAAWWHLKTLQNVSSAGSITFGAATGITGVLHWNEKKHVLETSPVYDMLARLKNFGPAWVIQKAGAVGSFDDVVFENAKGERLHFVLAQPDNW